MKKRDERSFEEEMEELEKIVAELENGDLTLDESLEKFKQGIEMSNHCSELLDDAEKSITILLKGKDGEVSETPFNVE